MLLSLNKYNFRKGRRLCFYHNDFVKERKTLIFLHDIGGHATNWQKIWRRFSSKYNVIAYDMIGHGLSDHPRGHLAYSITEQILDAQAVLEKYKSENIVLIGHGYGAIIALLLAKIYPKEVRKLVLIMPDVYEKKHRYWWHMMPAWLIQAYFFLGRKKVMVNHKHTVDFILPKAHVIKSYYIWCRYLPYIDLSKLKQQCLLISSRLEFLIEAKCSADYYKKHLPVCKVKYLDSSEHMPMIQDANAIIYYLDNFLDKLDVKAFKNLVFEGAGIRGIAYSGALLALNSMGVLEGIKRVAGSSAGAIYATFLAVGYNAAEIYYIVRKLDFLTLTGSAGNIIATGTRFLSDFSWYKGDAFDGIMGELIEKKTGKADLTFGELHASGGLEIYLVGTNLTKNCSEIYSHETTPEIAIVDAVRISTSIPMLFKAIKRKGAEGEQVLVDGGLSWNYPIEIFDYHRYVEHDENAEKCGFYDDPNRCFNHESLGFRLDPLKDSLHTIAESKEYKKIGNVIDFGKAFMRFVHASTMKRHLHKKDWQRTIYVDTLELGATDFDISPEDKKRLIEEGKVGVHKHFSWRMSRSGVRFPQ